MLDALQSGFLRFHQFLYETTNGAVGHRMIGVPTLLMRSTGRRTGAVRTAALVYARDGDGYVVVASNGGADAPPGWYYNVQDKPEVEVQIGRRRFPAAARIVAQGDADYDRLWRLVNEKNHRRYEAYQKKTSRPIAMAVLTPG